MSSDKASKSDTNENHQLDRSVGKVSSQYRFAFHTCYIMFGEKFRRGQLTQGSKIQAIVESTDRLVTTVVDEFTILQKCLAQSSTEGQ